MNIISHPNSGRVQPLVIVNVIERVKLYPKVVITGVVFRKRLD